MKFNATVRSLAVVSLIIMGNHTVAEDQIPTVTVDGLQLIKDTNLSLVYAQPGVDLSQYDKIYLSDAYVAFKKNWKRNQNRNSPHKITSDDMAKIKAELSLLFHDVFTKTLEDGGYELVTERAEDVLLVKPAIINLNIIAPDTRQAGMVRTYAESAGEMTLYLELYDSVTGDLIAKALDRRIDRETGYFEWQNRVTNRAAARRILQVWARVLKEGLDTAQTTGIGTDR